MREKKTYMNFFETNILLKDGVLSVTTKDKYVQVLLRYYKRIEKYLYNKLISIPIEKE